MVVIPYNSAEIELHCGWTCLLSGAEVCIVMRMAAGPRRNLREAKNLEASIFMPEDEPLEGWLMVNALFPRSTKFKQRKAWG